MRQFWPQAREHAGCALTSIVINGRSDLPECRTCSTYRLTSWKPDVDVIGEIFTVRPSKGTSFVVPSWFRCALSAALCQSRPKQHNVCTHGHYDVFFLLSTHDPPCLRHFSEFQRLWSNPGFKCRSGRSKPQRGEPQ